MKDTERILSDIYEENRLINRNLQRLTSIGLIALLGNILKEARDKGDDKMVEMGKFALFVLAFVQMLLMISDVSVLVRRKNEEEIDEGEEK